MELKNLIAECTAYDFKVMLEETIFASTDTPNVGDHVGDVSETKLTERQQKKLNLI